MNTSSDNIKFQRRLIYACDALVLNAGIITIAYAIVNGMDILWGFVLLNNAAIAASRQWLTRKHSIHWLESPLNRFLKRMADIIVSTAFLLTLFPVILLVMAIITKTRNRGPVITFRKARVAGSEFDCMCFSTMSCAAGPIAMSPSAVNILFGQISLWDLKDMTFEPVTTATPATAQAPTTLPPVAEPQHGSVGAEETTDAGSIQTNSDNQNQKNSAN